MAGRRSRTQPGWNPGPSCWRTEVEQATAAHGTRDPRARGVPGSKPRFFPLLPSPGPESPSAAARAPRPSPRDPQAHAVQSPWDEDTRSPAAAGRAEKGGARFQRAEVAFTGDYFPITELFIRKVMWAFVYEFTPHSIPPNLGSLTENIPLMLSVGSEKLFSDVSSVLSPTTCEARA